MEDSVEQDVDDLLVMFCFLRERSRRRLNNINNVNRRWVREIFQQRQTLGAYNLLIQEMRLSDRESHFR